MRNLTFILITLCIAVSSCASKRVFKKDDASPEEAARDDAQCRAQAMQIQTADYAYRGTFMEGANIAQNQKQFFYYCMEGKGYK